MKTLRTQMKKRERREMENTEVLKLFVPRSRKHTPLIALRLWKTLKKQANTRKY